LIPLCPDTIVDTTVNIINNINNEIIIIQNFASETINIKNLPVGENEINILDITGKSVFVGFTNWSDYTFRLNLGKGCYVINILDVGGNFLFSKSIII